jgi:hypothetical protein
VPATRAAVGGETLEGTFYRGGEFVPGDVVARAESKGQSVEKSGAKRQADIEAIGTPEQVTKRGIKGKIKSALDSLDEASHNSMSMIIGGARNLDPVAVASGITHLIGTIFRHAEEEFTETALADVSRIPAAALIGKTGAKAASAATEVLMKGAAMALRQLMRFRAKKHAMARQYARLAQSAMRHGDRHSARIYSRQAREARQHVR